MSYGVKEPVHYMLIFLLPRALTPQPLDTRGVQVLRPAACYDFCAVYHFSLLALMMILKPFPLDYNMLPFLSQLTLDRAMIFY